ncbi:AEC family transporter [Treponema sp.]
MNVASQVLVLTLLIIIGYIARKVKAIDDAAVHHFSSFVLSISLPALIVVSLQKPLSRELLGEAGIAFGLSLAVYAVSFGLAAFYPALIRADRFERGVYRYAIVFSNVGFMGYPVVEVVLGSEALFYLAIYNIPFNFLAFSLGAWLVARDGKRPLSLGWRTFINPSVIATLVGILLFLLSIRLPGPLYATLKMTGDIMSPLSMIVIGAILARMDIRKVVGSWRAYVTTLVRLIIFPALTGSLLFLLGFRGIMLALPALVVGMPIAANTSMMASVYEGDVESASAMVFISTLLCVITIPLIALLITPFV